MSTFDTPWFNSQNSNFFNTLNKSKTPHLVLTAETDDFDQSIIQRWTEECFDVRYVPLRDGGKEFIDRVHAAGDEFGLSEQYAIIAFGSAASTVLETHTKPNSPRLVAIVAYYPDALPSIHTRYPEALRVLIHLAGPEISVWRTAEVLGIQGKRRRVRKRIDPGEGHGELLKLPGNARVYTYSSAEPGFAESDLEEYDAVSAGLAFSRSVDTVRKGFRLEADGEEVRDRLTKLTMATAAENERGSKIAKMVWSDVHVLCAPTLVGGIGDEEVQEFYEDLFAWPEDASVTLISRTTGADRIADELFVSLTHSVDIPWLLPDVPPTGKKIDIVMAVISHVRGGKLVSEHTYWDQASVLVQAGLLDPKFFPKAIKKGRERRLPVTDAEGARAIRRGSSMQVNALIQD